MPPELRSPETSDSEDYSPPPSPTHSFRKVYYLHDDFELFHTLLVYLYTDRVCFTTSPDIIKPVDIPITADAEGVYAISHRFKLECLDNKAFHFLKATCNVRNITARTFSGFAAEHEVVGGMYDEYFLRHWEEVKRTDEFEEYFVDVEDDVQKLVRVTKKFRKMMKSMMK
jgi:hypothetical protein